MANITLLSLLKIFTGRNLRLSRRRKPAPAGKDLPLPYITARKHQTCKLLGGLSTRKKNSDSLDPDTDPGEVGLFLGIIEGLVFIDLAAGGQSSGRSGGRDEISLGPLDFRGGSLGGLNRRPTPGLSGDGKLVCGRLAGGKNGNG